MEARKVSARFAAFVWFMDANGNAPAARTEALRFADDNWETFLPCSHPGVGRLLMRIAGTKRRRRAPALAGAAG